MYITDIACQSPLIFPACYSLQTKGMTIVICLETFGFSSFSIIFILSLVADSFIGISFLYKTF